MNELLQDIRDYLKVIASCLQDTPSVLAIPEIATIIPSECPYTLYSWLDEWYNTYKVPNLKESSLYQLRVCIDKHIKGNIDDLPLNRLTPLDIQKTLGKIESTRMQKYSYDTLGACLTQAYKLGMIDDIMTKTDKIKHTRKQGQALTLDQQSYFLKAIKGNKLECLYRFYLLTGCRKSEALGIKWSDIDYRSKRIHVSGTKTICSDRYIPLFPELEKLLKKIPKTDELIFPYTDNLVNCNYNRMKTKYGIETRIHDLRHTFATRCLENGISINTVQKWLGHANASTTSNIYTHVQPKFELEEIRKFNPKF